jgi:hypothetical protein
MGNKNIKNDVDFISPNKQLDIEYIQLEMVDFNKNESDESIKLFYDENIKTKENTSTFIKRGCISCYYKTLYMFKGLFKKISNLVILC